MKSSIVSFTIHVGLIVAYMMATPTVDYARPRSVRRDNLIYVPPPAPIVDGGLHVGPGTNCRCIVAPKIVPPEIPPVGGVDTGPVIWAEPIVGPGFEASSSPAGGVGSGARHDSTGVFSGDVVDVQVTPYAGAPVPRYPEALRDANIEGEVVLEFVVDTMGRADLESMRVLSSPADGFVVSVRDALGGTRYHPALVGDRRVRQLVRQSFVFSLTQH